MPLVYLPQLRKQWNGICSMAMMKMRRQQLQRNPEADVSSKSLLRLGTQEENHTKTFAQSEALSRGSFLKVMLTGAAGALSAGSGLAQSLHSPVARQSKPLVSGLTQDTRLYGSTAVEIGGKAKLDDLRISVDCSHSGSMTWNVTVPEQGEFDLSSPAQSPSRASNWRFAPGPAPLQPS